MAISANPTAARFVPPADPGSRETMTMPAMAATMPIVRAGPGRSPPAIPTSTGTITLVARIGAATLIDPRVIAR